ncbi:MAG: hypothetical protein CME70_10705 [Halobacteriovorax sp.]|nr:hypothetical protein [Halobacteriovorax sp.]
MKVFSIVDNKAQETSLRKKGKKAVRGGRKKPAPKPPRENVTADQIRAKVKAFSDKNIEQAKLTKEKLAKFNAQKIPDLDDAEKEAHKGDVGINDPNDLATHGKLKQVLSMNAFSFSDKEKAALEKILKD